jgi:hypothetical protein
MKKLLNIVFGFYLFSLATLADAAMLSLESSISTARAGDTISLDLVISGLGDYTGDSLGDFDLDVAFDSSALSFNDYSLGNYLGDPDWFGAVDYSIGEYTAGIIRLAEVSLLTTGELDALQPDAFTLATLEFTVDMLDVGMNTLISIDQVYALGDGYGYGLPLDGTSDAVIAAVPAPASLLLMSTGLVVVGLFKKRERSK